jgi:hypothetical protein
VRRLKQLAQQLEYAVGFFGADVKLRDIDTIRLEEYLDHLAGKVKWKVLPRQRRGDPPFDGAGAQQNTGLSTCGCYVVRLSVFGRRARELEDEGASLTLSALDRYVATKETSEVAAYRETEPRAALGCLGALQAVRGVGEAGGMGCDGERVASPGPRPRSGGHRQ